MQNLLTRKEVCALRAIHPTTLYRWEKEGLPFSMGRIKEEHLAWWLEQREAARRLGMKAIEFFSLDRPEREKLLEQAHMVRCAGNS